MARKFDSYLNLTKFLKREGLPHSGKVATFLLHVFVTKDIPFNADTAREYGAISRYDNYLVWLKTLELKELITLKWAQHRYHSVRAGKRVVKYINSEIGRTEQVATQDTVDFLLKFAEYFAMKEGIPFDPPDFTKTSEHFNKMLSKRREEIEI